MKRIIVPLVIICLTLATVAYATQDMGSFTSTLLPSRSIHYTTERQKYDVTLDAVVNTRENAEGYVYNDDDSDAPASMTCWVRQRNGDQVTGSRYVNHNARVTLPFISAEPELTGYKLSCKNHNDFTIRISGTWAPDSQ